MALESLSKHIFSFSVASSCMDLRTLLLYIAFLPELLPLDRSKLKFEALKSREHTVFSHNFIVLEDKQRHIKFFRSLFELTSVQLGQCQLPDRSTTPGQELGEGFL